jgi:DNA-binding transcriptional ArsR family regulator
MDALATPESPADLNELGRFLIALGDPTRQRIVMLLSRQRLNVGELATHFPLSRPAMSHHLKVLADGGLLIQERIGRERVYRLDVARCQKFVGDLKDFVSTCCSGAACC